MRTWLSFYFLALISIKKCASEKHENEGQNFMDRNQNNAEKRRRGEFENNFFTEMVSKKANDAEYIHREYSIKDKKLSTSENIMPPDQQRDLIIGAPDLSDVCFRVYNESIVINAQPYERRSNMQLEKCKQRCMQSQNGIYNCRSFVYDFADKICDFYTHQGDKLPAKLLKYYEHLYLEPTFADGCDFEYASRELSSTELLNVLTSNNTNQEICEKGKVAKFLETQGFKLDSANRVDLKGYNLDACSDACTNNINDKKDTFGCRSFDYHGNGCSLFGEAAVPTGTRQLKQDFHTSYYEKICIDANLMSNECQNVRRFPQMLLVGFAEIVVTARSLIECFENCLKSRQSFGTNCTSVIYFYEELEQNCILNSENRQTQRNLFVKENIDTVDYFEINCPLRKRKKVIDDLVFRS
ncbi:PAN domain protein [Onchocerca flexuosa]|uniref:PAN domain protein n=1 Tax=Onchocerca flexuosa TaxID=387005 RepID=A0A238C1R8_9BILA|nr:PAN domain protein [Onchocerca flexuosa]